MAAQGIGSQANARATGPPTNMQAARAHVAWVNDELFGKNQDNPDRIKAHRGIGDTKKLTYKNVPLVNPVPEDQRRPQKLVLRLEKLDTFAAARELHLRYPDDKIAVLNMANQYAAGGGFLNGAVAQEEDLCHASTLLQSLQTITYPLRDEEVVHSPDVYVVRAKDPTVVGGILLPEQEWFFVDVISCAALYRPAVRDDVLVIGDGNEWPIQMYVNDADRDFMRNKIRWILHAAVDKGVQRLVLGALGCGVFRNPVHEVAQMMRELLIDDGDNGPEFDVAQHGLKEIVIAIYDRQQYTPVWGGFHKVFRVGGAFHMANANYVAVVPPRMQNTVFAPNYAAPSIGGTAPSQPGCG